MKRILAIFISLFITISLCSCAYPDNTMLSSIPSDTQLLVHYIDVGQGDCALLESGSQFVLIDAGEAEYGKAVCQYIKSRGAKRLSYVIATHPHSDHCGGIKEVLDTFECDNFITSETDQQTKNWLDVLYTVRDNNINYIDAEISSTYSFGNTTLEILGPYSNNYDNYNDYSVVIKATCGDTSFLFTGDAETNAEREMLENKADLKADVLKVSHHGSKTSSCEEFLDAVNPRYGVISCGTDNDYGHPHKEIVTRMTSRGITLFRTDLLGTIVACSNAKTVSFFFKNSEDYTENPLNTFVTTNSYIGNKNSKKFHRSTCDGAKDMNKKNKVIFFSREEAILKGYSPCKTCNP